MTYLESIALLGDDDLREEVRKYLVQSRTLHGRAWTIAYDRVMQLEKYLKDCGKDNLFREGIAAVEAEGARLRAANAAGRVSGLRRVD